MPEVEVTLQEIADNPSVAEWWWAQFEARTEQGFQDASRALQDTCHFAPKFDEVALLVTSAVHEYFLLESAVKNGWQWSNAAIDHVATSPIVSSYSVHYSFLTHPKKPWRVEVMRLLGGLSPLHAVIGGDIVEVHWSFKCKDEEWYEETVDNLLENNWQMAQSCESTYGKFSYWKTPEGVVVPNAPYLKPRANLRDAQNAGTAGAQA